VHEVGTKIECSNTHGERIKMTRKMFGLEKKGEQFVARSGTISTINRISRVLIKMDDIG
jgi:hypothetical protein